MEPERWHRIEKIFQQALELTGDERDAYVAAAAAGDEALRGELEELLSAHQSSGSFLDEPVVEGGISQLIKDQQDDYRSRMIGPYRLLKKLGEGGMSRVYLAVRDDDEYQKLVAVKVIPQDLDHDDLRRRFRTERQILASLDHPNIAKLLDGGTTDEGTPYFVMDYIEGTPIDEYCDRSRLSVVDRLRLFRTVCAAVQYAHQNLVVHRDIKASNILVTADGAPKLLDFGIAKLLKPEAFAVPVEMTATRIRPMTPSYASPEQIRGRHITTATDIYSLGVLLYKLLTGRLPHELKEKSAREVEMAILEDEPQRPSNVVSQLRTVETVSTELRAPTTDEPPAILPAQLRRRLSGDLDNIAMMALRKEPQRRYASAEMLSEDIRRHMEGLPVIAHRDSMGYRASKFVRRNRIALGVAAAFGVLLVGFALTMAVQARRLKIERDRVQVERDRAEQVVGFLEEIFASSDPLAEESRDVTAREILDRGRRRLETDLPDQPVTKASLLQTIGRVYYSLGIFDGSATLLRQALELRLEHLPADDLAVAESKDSLAVVLRAQGSFEEAERLLRESLEARREQLGPKHGVVAKTLVHLAQVAFDRGDAYDRSEDLFREALSIQTELFGADHPDIADTQSELAILLTQTGRRDEAERMFRQALDTRRKVLGEKNPKTAESINNLAVHLGIGGRNEEALPLFRESLNIRLEVLGDEHPDTGQSYNNLGRMLREQGDLKGAEELYRRGLEVWRKAHGDDGPRVAFVMTNLGSVLREQGRYEEAGELLLQALSIRRRTLAPGSPDLGWSLTHLGLLRIREGRPEAAEPLIGEALDLYETKLGEHWRTAEARTLLGEALAARSLYEEAEELLIEGHRFLRRDLGDEHRRTRDAVERLRGLYDAWGRPERLSAVVGG